MSFIKREHALVRPFTNNRLSFYRVKQGDERLWKDSLHDSVTLDNSLFIVKKIKNEGMEKNIEGGLFYFGS